MKIVNTSNGERGISLNPDEVLDWTTVRDAYRFTGCNKRLSKELAGHFFFAVTSLLSERENTLSIKEKATFYDREQRREERAHLRALEETQNMLYEI